MASRMGMIHEHDACALAVQSAQSHFYKTEDDESLKESEDACRKVCNLIFVLMIVCRRRRLRRP